jgi:hypothetical protein
VLLKRTMLPGRSTSLRKNLIVHAALLSFIALSATSCSSVVSHPLGSHRRHSPSPLALRHEATKRVGHSVDGRMILATRKAHPPVDRKGLVVGCIHGNECSGIPIARDLARDPVPKGIDLWVVSDLNPDGHFAATRQNADGVDLNRNFPYRWQPLGPRGSTYNAGPGPLSEPESAFIAKLILDKRPGISIWFHQQENLVDRSGGNVGVERRYAHLVGQRHRVGESPPSELDCLCRGTPSREAWSSSRGDILRRGAETLAAEVSDLSESLLRGHAGC